MQTKAELIAEWIEKVKFEDIPQRVVEKAKYQIMNITAALYSGSRSEGGSSILKTIRDWKIPGRCTIIPTGEKTSLLNAVLANSAFSIAYDFDDYMFMGHTCHSSVIASLAVAEENGLGGRDVILAQVAANEVEGRIGASVLLGPHNGQTWAFIHSIGSACATAKLMNLDRSKITNAVAISMYNPNYVLFPGFMGSQSKLLTACIPSVNGIIAAQLAANGFTGASDILDGEQGFIHHFSYIPLEHMLSGFGKSWATDSMSYKKYPGCAYIDSTVDALLMVMGQFRTKYGRKMEANDVERITVNSSLFTLGMDGLSKGYIDAQKINPVCVNFSIPLSVAVTLIAGKLTSEEMERMYLDRNRDAILELSRRVELSHDWSMTMSVVKALDDTFDLLAFAGPVKIKELMGVRKKIKRGAGSGIEVKFSDIFKFFGQTTREQRKVVHRLILGRMFRKVKPLDLGSVQFEKYTMPFAAEVVLKTKGGDEYRAKQKIPFGARGRDDAEIFETVRGKFRQEAGRFISGKKVEECIRLLEEFEGLKKVDEIISACCKKD
jgi:2-methylcitrate dehydratase PrpD